MWTVIDSPVGPLRLVEHNDALTAIEFSPFRDADGRPRGGRDDDSPVLVEAHRQVRASRSTRCSSSGSSLSSSPYDSFS